MVREITHDTDGRPICNVTARCSAPATLQAEELCTGCEDVATAHAHELEEKRAELAHYQQSVETVRQELERRADDGEPAALSGVEEAAVRLGMDKVRELGQAIETLDAAHAAVLAEHTHPVFACDKHEMKLPARPDRPDVPTEPHDIPA